MKQIIAVIFLVFVVIIGMNYVTYLDPNNKTSYQSGELITTDENGESESVIEEVIKVNITGEVEKPGSYEGKLGCFLEEIISKAGGVTKKADELCFDYYLIITTDLNIYIPPVSDEIKTSINEGSVDELTSLAGIGTTLAQRIITYRESKGNFSYLEQIMEVDGIGKSIFFKIRDHICL